VDQRAKDYALALPAPLGSGLAEETARRKLSSHVPFSAFLEPHCKGGLDLGLPMDPSILNLWMRLIQADKYVAGAGASSQLSCTVLITQSMYVTIITVALPVTT